MLRFFLRVVINAVALWVAGRLVGATIPVDSLNAPLADFGELVVIALIFGFLNALVRPILSVVTCPAYVLTLGLFTFVMNMIILWLLEQTGTFILGMGVIEWGGWFNMFIAGIIVSLVSFALNLAFGTRERA
jgi:putative membrane protein